MNEIVKKQNAQWEQLTIDYEAKERRETIIIAVMLSVVIVSPIIFSVIRVLTGM